MSYSPLSQLADEVAAVRRAVEQLTQRVARLERSAAVMPAATAVPVPPPYEPESGELATAAKPVARGELEQKIGGKWLAVIGVLALILGVSFFLKYAFDNNWIGPVGRVGIGVVAGVLLLVLGEFFRPRYALYGQILSGGGIGVLYLSSYAAHGFYHLVSSPVAFFFMTAVTLTAGILSVVTNQAALVVVGIFGGFLTPLLLATGQNNFWQYFSYVTVLDAGILGVSFYRNWRALNLGGLAGTALLYFVWAARHYTVEQRWPVVGFLTAYFVIFLAAAAVHQIIHRKTSEAFDLILLAVNGFGFFFLLYGLFDGHRAGMSFTAFGLAVLYFALAALSHHFNPEDKHLALALPSLSVTFLTVALGIMLKQSWLTLGWAVEALLLVWLSFTLKEKFYRAFAAVVSVLVLGRLLALEMILRPEQYTLLLNKRLVVFLISVACLSAAGWLYRQYKATVSDKEYQFVKAIVVCANLLILIALSAEVVDFYNAKINALPRPQPAGGYGSRAYPSFNSDAYRGLRQWESITLSMLWAVYAVGVIAVGFARKSRLLRVGGILLIGFTLLKFFLYDLWGLGTLYRIIISITLGVLLLLASFGYNKYKDRIKEMMT